jgi:hypothetical protein
LITAAPANGTSKPKARQGGHFVVSQLTLDPAIVICMAKLDH